MLRSLYSAVSGLRNHQTRMDVIGNNIANVNTVGYKSSTVVFQEVFNQTTRPAAAAGIARGGTNPMQVGLGMSVAAIGLMMNGMSAYERTDRALDVMIEGDGFFIINDGTGNNLYTRNGNFWLDNEGNLVTSGGLKVQGTMLDPPELLMPSPLDENGDPISNADEYDGSSLLWQDGTSALKDISIGEDFYNCQIAANGLITATYSEDGLTYVIGSIITAQFTNPSGVTKVGNSMYAASANSGAPIHGSPGEEGVAALSPGGLEMSDVDLSQEFTNMIVTQRGFQANSRVITVSDTLLEELINLKR